MLAEKKWGSFNCLYGTGHTFYCVTYNFFWWFRIKSAKECVSVLSVIAPSWKIFICSPMEGGKWENRSGCSHPIKCFSMPIHGIHVCCFRITVLGGWKQTLLKRITIMRFSLLIKPWNKGNSSSACTCEHDGGTGNGADDWNLDYAAKHICQNQLKVVNKLPMCYCMCCLNLGWKCQIPVYTFFLF